MFGEIRREAMKAIIEKNGKKYQVEAEIVNALNFKLDVYELHEDGSFSFVGKAFGNDIVHAFNQLIK
jgi:hypothetical protein